jgi:hypothetical protein
MDMPPPGWYADPYGIPGLLRWWDGSGWTVQTQLTPEQPRQARETDGPATEVIPGRPVQADDTRILFHSDAAWPPPQAAAGRRVRQARSRLRLTWLLATGAAVTVLIIAVGIALLGSQPKQAAASPGGQPPPHATPGPPSPAPSPTPTAQLVTDTSAGLSYAMLAAPWQAGCPATLDGSVFTWTSGESAVAGAVPAASGSAAPWYGSACSGPLGQQYPYSGVASLQATAGTLANAFFSSYYNGLPHTGATQQSDPLQVSGHPAWMVQFLVTYPNAASQGLAWQSELGAVVVVDRGTGQAPAVLYISVPSNLNTASVDTIIQSLQLAGQSPGPGQTPPTNSSGILG